MSLTEPDVNEKLVKELADALWGEIIGFKATEKGVAEVIRKAYREGWHRGWKDAPSDEF